MFFILLIFLDINLKLYDVLLISLFNIITIHVLLKISTR